MVHEFVYHIMKPGKYFLCADIVIGPGVQSLENSFNRETVVQAILHAQIARLSPSEIVSNIEYYFPGHSMDLETFTGNGILTPRLDGEEYTLICQETQPNENPSLIEIMADGASALSLLSGFSRTSPDASYPDQWWVQIDYKRDAGRLIRHVLGYARAEASRVGVHIFVQRPPGTPLEITL